MVAKESDPCCNRGAVASVRGETNLRRRRQRFLSGQATGGEQRRRGSVNPTQKYLIEEFVEEYHEHRMSRRELVRRAALIMGGLAAAASAIRASEQALAAVPALSVKPGPWPGNISGQIRADRTDGTNPPPAQTTDFVVPPDDPAIITEMVTFPGPA